MANPNEKHSKFLCKACGCPLTLIEDTEVGQIVLCCTVGRCPSIAANDGSSGLTEEAAYKQHVSDVEDEMEEDAEELRREH